MAASAEKNHSTNYYNTFIFHKPYLFTSDEVLFLNALGPGLLESAYEAVLMHELTKEGLEVKAQVPLPLVYDDLKMDVGYRIDWLVENKVLIEIKSVDNLAEVHHKQVLTYLKLLGLKLGILVNFNSAEIKKGISQEGK